MYVCLCHGISERKIRELIDQGIDSVKEIQHACKAGQNCGACIHQVREMASEHKNHQRTAPVPEKS